MTALMIVFGMMCVLITTAGTYICARELVRDVRKILKG